MTQPPGPPLTLDAPGAAAAPSSLECLVCDYDLQGLSPTGECPECGFPIGRTLVGRPFSPEHVEFVRGQKRAIGDLSLTITVVAISMISAVVLLALLRNWIWSVVLIVGGGVAVLLWARGWYRLSARDPDVAWEVRHRVSKRVLRWLALPGALGPLVQILMMALFGDRRQPEWFDAVVVAVGIVSMATTGAQILIGNRYLSALARRLRERSLARSLLRQAYAIVGLGLACVLLGRAPWWLVFPWAWFALGLADSLRRLGLAVGTQASKMV